MKKIHVIVISFFVVLMFVSAYPTLAQSNGADFELAVADYQQSHTTAAAEKVIKLAAAMDRLPAIPEEARRHFVRGATLFKDATSPDDFTQVLDEFKQATDLAPWWPEARYNLALAYEAAGGFAEAIDHLNLYLLFKLLEAESRTVQDKIYVLEAKQEKAAKESALQEQENAEEEWLTMLDRAKFASAVWETGLEHRKGRTILEIRGNKVLVWTVYTNDGIFQKTNLLGSNDFVIEGRHFTVHSLLVSESDGRGTISEDGETISVKTDKYEYVYTRMK